MRNRLRILAAFAATLAVAALAAGATAFPVSGRRPSPADLPKSGPVTVRVAFPDGAPAKGAVVTMGRQRFVADAKGVVAVDGIPALPGVAAADTVRVEGGFLGFFRKSVRYSAFSPVQPAAGAPLELALKLSPTPDLDFRCRTCHPDKPTSVAPLIRCVHKSGVPLKPALAGRVAQFNRENEELRKAGKPYYPPIVLETRKVKKGLFPETQPFLVCESCHSNHVETGYGAYVIMPFSEKSTLCRGCHV